MNLTEEAVHLVDIAKKEGLTVRALGGIGVRLRRGDESASWLVREYGDLDMCGLSNEWKRLDDLLSARLGLVAQSRFNAVNAGRQMMYDSPDGALHVDIFLDVLRMCHDLPFKNRLQWHTHTLSLSDLLLSKLQIVELTDKDIRDILGLLLEYPVVARETTAEIGLDRILSFCGKDWGWWRTVKGSLSSCRSIGVPWAPPSDAVILRRRLDIIEQAIDDTPKSLIWRARAKVGERRRWYQLPEAAR